jgi:Ca2+-binding RTX toxin-like protein
MTTPLFGGEGNDIIEGNEHNDTIFGGDGNDYIEGNAGNDIILAKTIMTPSSATMAMIT